MALTNAEKQRRWRERRNSKAAALDHARPKDMAEGILAELGIDRTRKILQALEKRVRAIKRDCPACHGTGFMSWYLQDQGNPDGRDWTWREACDCGPKAAKFAAPPPDHSWRVVVTTKDGKRWDYGARFFTEEDAREFGDLHAREELELEGYVTAEILRCNERPWNSIIHERGKSRFTFPHGTCHLLGWHEVGAPAPTSCDIGIIEPASQNG